MESGKTPILLKKVESDRSDGLNLGDSRRNLRIGSLDSRKNMERAKKALQNALAKSHVVHEVAHRSVHQDVDVPFDHHENVIPATSVNIIPVADVILYRHH
jgi:hypothetical protein